MTKQFGLAIVNEMNLITYASFLYMLKIGPKNRFGLGPQVKIEILLKRSG